MLTSHFSHFDEEKGVAIQITITTPFIAALERGEPPAALALPVAKDFFASVITRLEQATKDHFKKQNIFLDELKQAIQKTQKRGEALTQRNVANSLGVTERALQKSLKAHFPHLLSDKRGERWERIKALAESSARPKAFAN